ncbi:hypothetical protein [Rhodanobacter lindaniclasticus]
MLIVILMAHPELRLLVPMVDAVGVDVLMALCGAQTLAWLAAGAGPVLMHLRRGWLFARGAAATALRWSEPLLRDGSGVVGHYLWASLARRAAAPAAPPLH